VGTQYLKHQHSRYNQKNNADKHSALYYVDASSKVHFFTIGAVLSKTSQTVFGRTPP
jgi:hypothetical protein